jgi:hypothetical protein
MKFAKAADVRIGRDDAIGGVATFDSFIERRLPGGHNASGCHERHATLGNRLPQA